MGVPIYFASEFSLLAPLACSIDSTPPTFAGISSLVANPNGSLTASWLAGSDVSLPVRYNVYVQPLTATGLFATTPVFTTQGLTAQIFVDSTNTILQNGITYYVGIRAFDSEGNLETNVITSNAISSGVPVSGIINMIQEILDIEKGRWHITGNQMIFYKPDNVTEMFRFNLFDQASAPSMNNVFERVKV